MVIGVNYTYHGELFVMYIIFEAPCFTPKINVILYAKYTSMKKEENNIKL